MTRAQLAALMEKVFEECKELRSAGQKEYAHDEENAFANFERAAADLGLAREHVLWIFAMKHRDGIVAYLRGHKSQREDVRGRINDLITYLCILRGMIEENEGREFPAERPASDTEALKRRLSEVYKSSGCAWKDLDLECEKPGGCRVCQ